MIPYGTPLDQRLAHYSIPEPNSGCLLWTASVNHGGYGTLGWKRRSMLAHRLAWELANGPIPKGLYACHKCDVPSCINPQHLFLGTHRDNRNDCKAKGRLRHIGFNLHHAKLTPEQVLLARHDKRSCEKMGKALGVSASSINNIRLGRTWKHISSAEAASTTPEGK